MVEREVSVWTNTDDVDHMLKTGSDRHSSHDNVLQSLSQQYGTVEFSVLDVGVMSGISWEKFSTSGLNIDYTGIDVSDAVLLDCSSRFPGVVWENMSATDLEYDDNSFDVVHARHLLEGLPYYETAIREMFRVAKDVVILIFFQVPRDPELLLRRATSSGYIWLNRYSPAPLEQLLDSLASSVESFDVKHEHKAHKIYYCQKP